MMQTMLQTFWSPKFWLPPNTTWADIQPGPDKLIEYADSSDLIYPLPMAFVMLLIRYVLDRFWFAPVGIAIGIKNSRPKKAAFNTVLEAAYQKSSKIRHKQDEVRYRLHWELYCYEPCIVRFIKSLQISIEMRKQDNPLEPPIPCQYCA